MSELAIRVSRGHYNLVSPGDVQVSCSVQLTVDGEEKQVVNVWMSADTGEHLLGHDGDDPQRLLAEIVAVGGRGRDDRAAKAMLERIDADYPLSRDLWETTLTQRQAALVKRRASVDEELEKTEKSLAFIAEEKAEATQ